MHSRRSRPSRHCLRSLLILFIRNLIIFRGLVVKELHLLSRKTLLELPRLTLHVNYQFSQNPLAFQKFRYADSMFKTVFSFGVIWLISSVFSTATYYAVVHAVFFAQRRWRVNLIKNVKFKTHVLKHKDDGIYKVVENDRDSQRCSKVMEEGDDSSFTKIDWKLLRGCACWSVVELSSTSTNYRFQCFDVGFSLLDLSS